MTFEIFLAGVVIVAVLVGLITEAIKKICDDNDEMYKANLVAGITSIIVSVGVSIAYIIVTGTIVDANLIVAIIALTLISWIGAMIGYDKIKEAITQIND